jgi:hypothetical protein
VHGGDTIEPAIQAEYLRSSGATTSTFILEGARIVNFLRISLADTGNIVVPSEGTLLQYRFILISTAHIMMLREAVSWIPLASSPRKRWIES